MPSEYEGKRHSNIHKECTFSITTWPVIWDTIKFPAEDEKGEGVEQKRTETDTKCQLKEQSLKRGDVYRAESPWDVGSVANEVRLRELHARTEPTCFWG